MKRVLGPAALFAAVAIFAGCGGGSVGTPLPAASAAATSGTVQFTVFVPAGLTPVARRPKFTTPAGAQSVTFTLGLGAPTVVNLTASTPGCTSAPAGLTCVVSVTAPAGSDVFTVTAYSGANGQGTMLGSGNVTVTATAGQTTTAPTTLSGTVASVALSITQNVPVGVTGSVPVTIVAKDANGNAIIGTYSSPITLTDTDASGQTSLSATSVPDSTTAAAITLSYKGGAMTAPASIGASATGVSNIEPAHFTPDGNNASNRSTVFSSAQWQTGGYYGATPLPIPTFTALRTATWTTGASFNNMSGLVNEHTSIAQPNSTASPVAFDAYMQWSSSAPYSLAMVGGNFSNSLQTDILTCTAPYAPLYVSGSTSFQPLTGSGPCTDTYGTGPSSETFTQNADGSYIDATPLNAGYWSNLIVHSDGTAYSAVSNPGTTTSWVIAIYTPAPNASTIPVYVRSSPGPLATTNPSPGPANTSIPNWYAQAGITAIPNPLRTETVTLTQTNVTLPTACPVSSSILGNATISKQEEVFSSFDPLYSIEQSTSDKYLLNGVGLICLVENSKTAFFEPRFWLAYPSGNGAFMNTLNLTYYATSTSLQAAARQAGVRDAMAAQGAMLIGAARAERIQRFSQMRHAAMLRTEQAIRQHSR